MISNKLITFFQIKNSTILYKIQSYWCWIFKKANYVAQENNDFNECSVLSAQQSAPAPVTCSLIIYMNTYNR